MPYTAVRKKPTLLAWTGLLILCFNLLDARSAFSDRTRLFIHPERVIFTSDPSRTRAVAIAGAHSPSRNPGLKFKPLGSHSLSVEPRLGGSIGRRVQNHSLPSASYVPPVRLTRARNPCLRQRMKRLARRYGLLCEPDSIMRPTLTPNDTHYSSLWGLHGAAGIGAPSAWDHSSGSGIVVAVLDTGVDRTHPDLAANMWINPDEIPGNGIDDDGNGYIDDVHGWDFYDNDNDPSDDDGHGTHVSGTIAAVGNNSLGIIGVAYGAQIMALRFIGPLGGYTSDAVLAINYAIDKGVKISNNSWGGYGFSTSLYNAINNARAAGMLFVAAAGNDNINTDITPHYPSSYTLSNVISVGSISSSGARSSFSNYGAISVDLFAPGSSILSTTPSSSYSSYDGTSMASPHVAGVAAQVLSLNSGLSLASLKDTILNSSTLSGAYSGLCVTSGRLSAATAVLSVELETPTPTPSQTPNATLTPSPTATVTPPPTPSPGISPTHTPTPQPTPAFTSTPTPTVVPSPLPDSPEEPEDPFEDGYGLVISSEAGDEVLRAGSRLRVDILGETPGERVRLALSRSLTTARGTRNVQCGITRAIRLSNDDATTSLSARTSGLARYLDALNVSLITAGRAEVAQSTVLVKDNIASSSTPRQQRVLGGRACLAIARALDASASARGRRQRAS